MRSERPDTSTEEHKYHLSLLDTLIPMDDLVTSTGAMKPGASALLLQRQRHLAFFAGNDMDDEETFTFYTRLQMTDENIYRYIHREGPLILLPKVLDRFARHRWNGAQEVFAMVAVFGGTKNLLKQCVPTWLGKKNTAMQSGEGQLVVHSGYRTQDVVNSRPQIVAIASGAPAQGPEVNEAIPAQPSPEFYKKMQDKTMTFAESSPGPGPIAIIACICNYHMDKGLRRKLYIAGEKWQKANDIATSKGEPRKYRICEIGSNAIETEAAKGSLCRLCFEDQWGALPRKHWTLNNRSLCTRALTRQVGAIVVNMKVPQEQSPFTMFEGLTATDSRREQISKLCKCLHCDFAAYWLEHYPGENYSKPESMACLATMAEDIRCESCRSECGHSFWQCVCRARSLQTHFDSIQAVSASSLMRQNRLIELPFKVTPAPKRLGRPPLPAGQKKKRRTKTTGDATKKKRHHKPVKLNGWWGPWRVWTSDNKRKGEFGKGQFEGRAVAYQATKGTAQFEDLVRRGHARAHAKLTAATDVLAPEPTSVAGLAAASVHFGNREGHETAGEISQTAIVAIAANVHDTLVAYENNPPNEIAAATRRLVRENNAKARAAQRLAETKHAEWLNEQNTVVQDEVFAVASAVNGVTAVASTPGISRVFWHVPAREMAEKILSGAGQPRTTSLDDGSVDDLLYGSTHYQLRSKWAARHTMYKHDEQEDQSKVRANKYRSSLGRQLGFCVCGDDTFDILLFRGSLLQVLRRLFDNKSKTNPEQQWVESNSSAMRLVWDCVDDAAGDDEEYVPNEALI